MLEPFGAPDDVWSDERGLHWVCGHGTDAEGRYAEEIWMLFRDGIVTTLGIR